MSGRSALRPRWSGSSRERPSWPGRYGWWPMPSRIGWDGRLALGSGSPPRSWSGRVCSCASRHSGGPRRSGGSPAVSAGGIAQATGCWPGLAMVRDVAIRPAIGLARPALPSKTWLLLPALLVAAAVAVGAALAPLIALLALALVVVVACVWKWPALAAYLVIGLTPLTAGINRGSALPLLRPNEALALLVGVTLATRGIVQLRTGQLPRLSLGGVEVSMVLLAVCSSVVPLWWMTLRQQQFTGDELLYALVLWKYLALYALIRMSVRTDRQIGRCLWLSIGAGCIVSVLAILQSLG